VWEDDERVRDRTVRDTYRIFPVLFTVAVSLSVAPAGHLVAGAGVAVGGTFGGIFGGDAGIAAGAGTLPGMDDGNRPGGCRAGAAT
jgi:hypothetical protein